MTTTLFISFDFFILREKMTVHIFTLDVGPVVSDYYAIWVDHWNYPPFKSISQFKCKHIWRYQEVDKTVNHETRMGFTWVLSTNYQNYWLLWFFIINFLVNFSWIRNLKNGDIEVSEGFPERFDAHYIGL